MDGRHADLVYSIVVLLAPLEETTVPATVGEQAHAALLSTLRAADPALAEALHVPNVPTRPFTVSALQGVPPARDGRVQLSPEHTYWLRFTVLYPPIYRRFMARFLQGEGRPVIRLGQARLLIREILVTPGSHPWAGYSSWPELVGEAQPAEEVALEFASPTAFGFGQKAWGKKIVVLPAPELVFGSLVRSWDLLAPPELGIDRGELMPYVEEHVVVKRIEGLRTQMLHYRRALQVGFVGRVTYGLMGDHRQARCQLDALSKLAFYSGVGIKTTMGMGQVRRAGVRE
jgi:CRISPR-associated endoribonuclease Cas6